MRILNDKYRLFGIINPVDLLVLAIVAVLAFVIADVMFGSGDFGDAATETMEIVFVVENVKNFDADSLRIGDVISDKRGGDVIGTLVGMRTEPSKLEGMDASGAVVVGDSTMLENVYLTIQGEARTTDEGVMFGSVTVRVNRSIDVATPLFEFKGSGQVVSIRSVD
ncbi:MAG: DUF4330 domain-containing protein [Actinomycetota bacterium]|nr:DUF4330 domain-containing protein [Actinomycetota bacterium]